MKKLTVFVIVFSLLAALLLPEASAVSSSGSSAGAVPSGSAEAPSFENDFVPATAGWKNLVAGTPPATFKNVTYHLADNVVRVNSNVTNHVATANQILSGSASLRTDRFDTNRVISGGAYLPRDILDNAAAQQGKKNRKRHRHRR